MAYDKTERFSKLITQTPARVGPGTYDQSFLSKPPRDLDNRYPFLSGTRRQTMKILKDAINFPGPGSYNPGGVSIDYTEARSKDEIYEGPGPAEYDLPDDLFKESPRKIKSHPGTWRGPAGKVKFSLIIIFIGRHRHFAFQLWLVKPPRSMMTVGLSVPSKRDVYGYDVNEYGILVKNPPIEKEPAFIYDLPRGEENFTTIRYKGNFWSRMTGREKKGPFVTPGPGDYDHETKRSRTQIYYEKFRELKRATARQPRRLQKKLFFTKGMPGPNNYNPPKSAFDKYKKINCKCDKYAMEPPPFNQTAERFKDKKCHDIPGPGTYEIKQAECCSTHVCRAPFGSLVSRFKKPPDDSGPAPGGYHTEVGNVSYESTKRFVNCYYKKPMPYPKSMQIPKLDIAGDYVHEEESSKKSDVYHAVFKSKTERFAGIRRGINPYIASSVLKKSFNVSLGRPKIKGETKETKGRLHRGFSKKTLRWFATPVKDYQHCPINCLTRQQLKIDEFKPQDAHNQSPLDKGSQQRDRFPTSFHFGVATSAYQTEGAWNQDGKEESVWDHMTHKQPCLIADERNADVSADSYHNYKKDVQIAKEIGSKMYKISLSWPRIMLSSQYYRTNPRGIEYYNNFIDEIIANGMTPIVTLFHWDLPYSLQQLGGLSNPLIIEYLVEYAIVAFNAFGDRVKFWITINAPSIVCQYGYGSDSMIPAMNQSGTVDYICGHNLLLAHSEIYNIYQKNYRPTQNGKVGIALDLRWYEPANPKSMEDNLAAERAFQWWNGWFLNPLFGENGDYPEIMKKMISELSTSQGYLFSRLPVFDWLEVQQVQKSADFLGINYHNATLVRAGKKDSDKISFWNDAQVEEVPNNWPGELHVKNTPWAFAKLLKRIDLYYQLPSIIITENGYMDTGKIQDKGRCVYHHGHLSTVLQAMKDGIDIRGYLVRSLFDSFEWMLGYTVRSGIYSVNFTSVNRTRQPKSSAVVITDIYKNKYIRPLKEIMKPVVNNKL
ncbi:hypothetical protein KPH14_003881 [Odynerus spinipes]|uniref:Uncharacterized protein n=1 Tax=Odynerus spinipes TaxID=1348599 RepID=A0AAD9RXH8_9HYME|nr:hypothetical protein KPH14_003881 [Odynerus spinipes]